MNWNYPSSISANSSMQTLSFAPASDGEIAMLFDTFHYERPIFKNFGSRLLNRIGQTRTSKDLDALIRYDAERDVIDNIKHIEPIQTFVTWHKKEKMYSIEMLYKELLTQQQRRVSLYLVL